MSLANQPTLSGTAIPSRRLDVVSGHLQPPEPRIFRVSSEHELSVAPQLHLSGVGCGAGELCSCSCGWRQDEDGDSLFRERAAWMAGFDHALGPSWRKGPVIPSPGIAHGGRGNDEYLDAITAAYGGPQRTVPYLSIGENCELADAVGAVSHCEGVFFGRGDGAADDGLGICMSPAHDLALTKCCGDESGPCNSLATKPDGPFTSPARNNFASFDPVLCEPHWLSIRNRVVTEADQLRRAGDPDWSGRETLARLWFEARGVPTKALVTQQSVDTSGQMGWVF